MNNFTSMVGVDATENNRFHVLTTSDTKFNSIVRHIKSTDMDYDSLCNFHSTIPILVILDTWHHLVSLDISSVMRGLKLTQLAAMNIFVTTPSRVTNTGIVYDACRTGEDEVHLIK